MSLRMVGTRLREARERAGRSQEEIADATKVKLERIAALEEGAFDRLPSGIYLHGIVKAYAREIGLDAEELIRQLRTSPEIPQPDDERAQLALLAEVRLRRETSAVDTMRDAPEPQARAAVGDRPRQSHALAMVLLIVGLLGAFAAGGYLYTTSQRDRAVARGGPQIPTAASQTSQPESGEVPRAESPRIDAAMPSASPVTIEQVKRPAERTPRRATGTTGVARRSASAESSEAWPAVRRKASRARVGPGVNPAPAVVSESREEPAPDSAGATDVTGVWRISTEVAASSVSAFQGLRLRFLLNLRQQGDRIVGSGRKVAENDTALPTAAQTRITVEGRRDGDQLTLTFRERGGRRESSGRFLLTHAADDEMLGTFTSSAARSAGPVKAHRR